MKSAPIPRNENSRLQDLYSYGMLDTEIDEDFEAVLDLILAATGAGMATISLVDTDRQWMKAARNVEAAEWARNTSFDGFGILSEELLVVEDALQDERFRDSPLVTGPPYVRFYAGAPLMSERGYILGMLAVQDVEPRAIDQHGQDSLRALSNMTVNLLELRRQRRRNTQLQQALEHRERNTLQTLASLLNIYAENSDSASLDNRTWIRSVRDRLHATSCMLGHVNANLGDKALSTSNQLPMILKDMLRSTEIYARALEMLRFEQQESFVSYSRADPLLLLLYEAISLAVDAGVDGEITVSCCADMRSAETAMPMPTLSFVGDEHTARSIGSDIRFLLLETLAGRLSAQVELSCEAGRVTIGCCPMSIEVA